MICGIGIVTHVYRDPPIGIGSLLELYQKHENTGITVTVPLGLY